MPFMAVVSRPELIKTNHWLKYAYDVFSFKNEHDFLMFLGFIVLIFMVLSNFFKAMTSWLTLRYDNHLNYSLSCRLLAQYLARPYSFFLNRNTSDMGKNVLAEVKNVIAGVLSAGMQVLSNCLVSFFILTLLLIILSQRLLLNSLIIG